MDNLKNMAIKGIKVFITLGVIYWIIYKLGLEKIVDTVSQANPFWFLLAIVIFLISIFLGAYQWRAVLKVREVNLSVKKAISIYMTGIFINNFMFGMVAGDAYKVAALHLEERKGESGFAATFIDRLAGLMVISAFAIIGGIFLFIKNSSSSRPILLTVLAISFFVVIFGGVFATIISQRLQKLVWTIFHKLPVHPLREKLEGIMEAVFINRHNHMEQRMIITVALVSIIIQSMRISVHILCALALGIFHIEQLHYFFIIIPVTALMMLVPLPFGVKESLAGMLFGIAGFGDEAIVMEFLATLVGIGASLFGGITFILQRSSQKGMKPSP